MAIALESGPSMRLSPRRFRGKDPADGLGPEPRSASGALPVSRGGSERGPPWVGAGPHGDPSPRRLPTREVGYRALPSNGEPRLQASAAATAAGHLGSVQISRDGGAVLPSRGFGGGGRRSSSSKPASEIRETLSQNRLGGGQGVCMWSESCCHQGLPEARPHNLSGSLGAGD